MTIERVPEGTDGFPVDIVAAADASAAAGADLGGIWPLSRRTPDGTLLEWRLAAPHPAPATITHPGATTTPTYRAATRAHPGHRR